MALVRIATIKSRVKGYNVSNYKYMIGEVLECKFEVENKYSSHAIMLLGMEKNKKSKGKTSKESDKEWIKVDHIPDALAEILFSLLKEWKIYGTKTIIS